MGWLFSSRWNSRKQILDYLRSKERWGDNFEILRSQAVGNNHWYVAKIISTNQVFIGLDLMSGGREEGWGYKDMDETCGPNVVNCPLGYLDLADEPTGYAVAWRERVRAFYAKQALVPKPAVGVIVSLNGVDYELTQSLGRKGWYVRALASLTTYRMSFKTLKRCTVPAAS